VVVEVQDMDGVMKVLLQMVLPGALVEVLVKITIHHKCKEVLLQLKQYQVDLLLMVTQGVTVLIQPEFKLVVVVVVLVRLVLELQLIEPPEVVVMVLLLILVGLTKLTEAEVEVQPAQLVVLKVLADLVEEVQVAML
jgi:hypothetical protein